MNLYQKFTTNEVKTLEEIGISIENKDLSILSKALDNSIYTK